MWTFITLVAIAVGVYAAYKYFIDVKETPTLGPTASPDANSDRLPVNPDEDKDRVIQDQKEKLNETKADETTPA